MVKILVVDNEPELRDQLAWAANAEGREVVKASSGQEAIRLIRENQFDIIVADLVMETDNAGLDVLRAAKEKDVYTQVIIVTVWGTPKRSVETMRLGAFDYLERNSPGIDFLMIIPYKIALAIEFREAKLKGKSPS